MRAFIWLRVVGFGHASLPWFRAIKQGVRPIISIALHVYTLVSQPCVGKYTLPIIECNLHGPVLFRCMIKCVSQQEMTRYGIWCEGVSMTPLFKFGFGFIL